MGYVYATMWLIVGLILIFHMSKENKIFNFAGGYFILLGAWWFFNTFMPNLKLFEGAWGIALRVITGIALLAFCAVFFKDYKKETQAQKGENPDQTDTTPKNGGDKS